MDEEGGQEDRSRGLPLEQVSASVSTQIDISTLTNFSVQRDRLVQINLPVSASFGNIRRNAEPEFIHKKPSHPFGQVSDAGPMRMLSTSRHQNAG